MLTWDLRAIETPGGRTSPVVLFSEDSRAVLVGLDPGQELGDHEVKERAWLSVVDGEVQIASDGEPLTAGPGTLVTFEPGERHAVRSAGGARVLLLLAPWPADDHYPDDAADPAAVRPAGPR